LKALFHQSAFSLQTVGRWAFNSLKLDMGCGVSWIGNPTVKLRVQFYNTFISLKVSFVSLHFPATIVLLFHIIYQIFQFTLPIWSACVFLRT
jgi:hypothetical protein